MESRVQDGCSSKLCPTPPSRKHLLSITVIFGLHVALVATRVALALGPEARGHFLGACTCAQAVHMTMTTNGGLNCNCPRIPQFCGSPRQPCNVLSNPCAGGFCSTRARTSEPPYISVFRTPALRARRYLTSLLFSPTYTCENKRGILCFKVLRGEVSGGMLKGKYQLAPAQRRRV
eukprot:1667268-Pleurochrysis_carterae.AAC.2